MNKEAFAKRLALPAVLPILAGMLVLSAGCTTQNSGAPVRDSRPVPATRTALKPPDAIPPVAKPGEHVVRRGETLYAVSRLYGVPVQDLIAWNNLSRPEQLDVGQVLRVAAPEAVAEPLAPPPAPPDAASLPEIKREPRGGKEAWSEEAWARLQPQAQTAGNELDAGMPVATISRPELSAPEPSAPEPSVPKSSAPEPSASGDWMWPVKGAIISQFDDPTGSGGKLRNKGIDIAGTPGTPVLAAAGGKVAYAGNAVRGFGNMVIVKHNDEYLTAYAHNRVILVKEGEAVNKGQKIAELGSSDTDRPKLHFELRKQGTPVDPLKYLPGL
ncbi:MAG: peptidoglycan DD-metalloendopeptidase family protein [Betaproteobacteria bacterium]|nr:peptidoglycan DD-metalloendopeptidase family protein [Betaproteobacteria bacterium]